MAHKKASSGGKNGRDSGGQRRGVKCFGGEPVTAGSILVRQVGAKFTAGLNVKAGRDHTLFALKAGTVFYDKDSRRVNVQTAPVA